MHCKINSVMMALAASWLIITVAGCASSPATTLGSPAQPAALRLEQPAMTDYMRSRVGTQDELSPIAPPEARSIHKVGNQWVCEVNGKTMVYNNASACWEPKP
jgi:hypothetical protein